MPIVDLRGDAVTPGEDGEVRIHGHHMMKGCGDLADATVGGDGYLYIVDCKTDSIRRHGVIAYPRETVEVRCQHAESPRSRSPDCRKNRSARTSAPRSHRNWCPK